MALNNHNPHIRRQGEREPCSGWRALSREERRMAEGRLPNCYDQSLLEVIHICISMIPFIVLSDHLYYVLL